jgi:AcrR family transcriptional regulator
MPLETPDETNLVKSLIDDPKLIQRRRGQFVIAAIKLFSRKGYGATTIKEIAKEAGVSTGLIYQYVENKEDILFLALQRVVDTNRKVLPAVLDQADDPILRFIVANEAYCRVIDANRDAVLLTYRETKTLSRRHRAAIKEMEIETNEYISDTVRQCIAAGYFREFDVELVTYHMITMAHAWALKHWRFSEIFTLEGYIKDNIDLILHSLLTTHGWKHYSALQSREKLERVV